MQKYSKYSKCNHYFLKILYIFATKYNDKNQQHEYIGLRTR